MKSLLFRLIILTLFLTSCEDTTNSNDDPITNPSTDSTTVETPTPPTDLFANDPRKPLYLQGVYATSNDAMVGKIFDASAATVWKTKKGAGPDEGIMLYFQDDFFIKKMEIETASGNGFAEVSDFIIYGNGNAIGMITPGEEMEVENKFRALFIRLGETDQEKSTEVNVADKEGMIKKFSKNHSVGIQKIKIWGEDGKEIRLVPPRKVKAKVTASSTLEPLLAYSTSKLFDTRKEFAWVEGAEGSGDGEQLTFQLQEAVEIDKVQIWNGYQRSSSHYRANARMKGFSIGETDGKMYDYTLRDDDTPQKIDLKVGLKNKNFELKINSFYKGGSYKDLAISEMLFFENEKPLQLIVADAAAEKAIVQKAKGTVLEPWLDSRIGNSMNYKVSGFYADRSIILRSDGTFVMYLSEVEDPNDETNAFISIADGNWEILNANATEAKIKIFGKLLDVSAVEAYYGGMNEQAEFSKIFKDNLTIKNNTITGEKILDEIVIQ